MSESNNTPPADDKVSKVDYEKAIERARGFEAKLTDYEKRFGGVDLDSLKAKAEEADLLRKELASGGDTKRFDEELDKRVKDIRSDLQKQLDALTENANKLRSENKELKVVDRVFAEHSSKFVDSSYELLKREIRERLDLDDGGNIYVRGTDGKPQYSKVKPAELMSVDEFVSGLIEKFPFMAKNPNVGGVKQEGHKTGDGASSVPAGFASWDKAKQTEFLSKNPQVRKAILNGQL